MTDCRLEIVFDKACSNLLQNRTLNQVMYEQMQALGPLRVDPGLHSLAGDFQATLDSNDVDQVSRPLASVLRGKVPAVFEAWRPTTPLWRAPCSAPPTWPM